MCIIYTTLLVRGQSLKQFKEIPHIVIFEIDWNVQCKIQSCSILYLVKGSFTEKYGK